MPEDKNNEALLRETQIAALREQLVGNQVFARLRGRARGLVGLYKFLLEQTGSPSEALRRWDKLVSDGRVLLTMLAKLHRDGQQTAVEELLRSLREPNFLFTGETVPIEQTTPLTIVIPNADYTWILLEWIMRVEETRVLFDHIEYREEGITPDKPEILERVPWLYAQTEFLLKYYPTILQRFRSDYNRPGSVGADDVLLSSHGADILAKFDLPGGIPLHVAANRQHTRELNLVPGSFIETYAPGKKPMNGRRTGEMAYLFPGEQKDVLKGMDRRERRLLGAWQLRIPTVIWDSVHDRLRDKKTSAQINIEIFNFLPMLEVHQRQRPAYTSMGVSHRMGARWVLSSEGAAIHPPRLGEDEPFRCLLTS